jgi:hypothetical protein
MARLSKEICADRLQVQLFASPHVEVAELVPLGDVDYQIIDAVAADSSVSAHFSHYIGL